jgi:hypothetical protein
MGLWFLGVLLAAKILKLVLIFVLDINMFQRFLFYHVLIVNKKIILRLRNFKFDRVLIFVQIIPFFLILSTFLSVNQLNFKIIIRSF